MIHNGISGGGDLIVWQKMGKEIGVTVVMKNGEEEKVKGGVKEWETKLLALMKEILCWRIDNDMIR